MRQLPLPPHVATDVFASCVAEVSDSAASQNYFANQHHIEKAFTDYHSASATASWCSLPRAFWGKPQAIVVGSLTKEQLTDLYTNYMVATAGAARNAYDDIMVAADGKCPFCGGIGQVHTLDHYLPKAIFPLFSVLPANLIPCCRDCNSGKGSSFGTQVGEQSLHPYVDDVKFFQERWIVALVERTTPLTLHFQCSPPQHWSAVDRARASSHFTDYKLAKRFRIQAGAELAKVVDSRKGSLRSLSPQDFRANLTEGANSAGYDLNGWNRTMYDALANTSWFYNADLNLPYGLTSSN